jgi:Family of unknown function (DUF5677)
MKTTHIHAGFLSDVVKEHVEQFHELYGHWWTLFTKVNTFACSIRLKLPIRKEERVRNVFTVCVFGRLLDAYQCVLILLERGAGDEAKSQLRNVLESLFVLGANLRQKTFAKRYILADEDAIRNMAKKALTASRKAKRLKREVFLDSTEKKGLQKRLSELEVKRKAGKLVLMRDYMPSKNAKAGGPLMVFEYEKAYSYLCGYAHLAISGVLHKYFSTSAGKFRFEVGPNFEETPLTCRVAIDLLLVALELLNKHYKLCASYQLTKLRKNLDDLR